MRVLRFAIAVSIVLLLLPSSSPTLADGMIVIDRFNDDVAEATLDFKYSLVNSSLAIDVPPGVILSSAELTVEGVGVNGSPSSRLDFNNGLLSTNVWGYWNEGQRLYPPTVDPRNHAWNKINDTSVKLIQKVDGDYWITQTTGQGMPPYEWPLQLYRFAPVTTGATKIEVMWNGSGEALLNNTAPYQADLWFYDHTDDVWDRVASYAESSYEYTWLNYSFDLPSPYLATDGSVDVIVAGPHSDNSLVNLPGILLTDYIGIEVTSVGGLQYPADLTLSIDDVEMATVAGNITDPVTIGAGTDLLTNLQTVLDSYKVTPDNVTLVLDFSVGRVTAGMLTVKDLLIIYTSLTNSAPEYLGPTSVVVDEDSGWTSVMNLDTAFDDDFNVGELLFDISIIDWPGYPLAQFRVGTDDGGNRTLDVLPENDFFGELPETVEVIATDLFGLEAFAELDVTVLQQGDPPLLKQVGTIEAHERATTTFTVNVTDVDLPDDVFTFSDDTDLLDIDPVTGEVSWTPSPDQIGRHEFRIIVTDRFGYSDWVQVTIVVENSNDPPVITSNEDLKAKQDEETTYLILTEDPDVPFGDVLSYFAFADTIDIDVDPSTGWMTFTPTNDQVPSFDITIRVEDLIGETAELTLHVTVENVNDPPVFHDVGELNYDQGENVIWTLGVDDPDTELGPPLTDVLTFTSVGADLFSTDDGTIEFQAGQDDVGTHEVTYTVTDSGGLSDVVTITWTIRDVNDAPVITNQLPDSLDEDEEFSITMTATDADGNSVTWADDTDMFDIDPSTGEIAFTPTQDDVGTHQIIVTASDGWDGQGMVTFSIEIKNVNDDPMIGSVLPASDSIFDEGDKIELRAQATDEDGDQLTYVWTYKGKELGRGAVVETDDIPAGTSKVVLTVTDGNGGSATDEITVTVESSASSSMLLSIAIIVIIVVVVIVAMAIRGLKSKGATAPEKPEEGPIDDTRDEKVEFDVDSVSVMDETPITEAPYDFGEGSLEDVTEVPPAPEEAPIYNLEEAEEYRPE